MSNLIINGINNHHHHHHHHVVPPARIPWPSLATPPYRSSLLAGPQGYIPYPHRAAVCMFELAVLLLFGHMWGSIGVHHLWARPCFSSSVLSNLDSFRDGRQPLNICFEAIQNVSKSNRVLRVWIEVLHRIFSVWEEQTRWNL